MITSFIMMVAYLLDYFLGEVKRFHPLVGFGWMDNVQNRKNS